MLEMQACNQNQGSKSSIGFSKINNDSLEAMVWVFGQLVTLIMAREWDMLS
jgi:hypothetical protein